MKKNSEQNTKKKDRFILEIPADIKQSLNMPHSPSETTTPVVSKTLNTPIPQSSISQPSLSKAESLSSTSSSPVTIRNIRLPVKYSYLDQESSAREKSVQDSAQSAENYGNCYITLFILFILIISLHFNDHFLDFKAENTKLKAQNDEF
jgi:hypothetical protein